MNCSHILKVLVWKHFTVRLRRYVFTTIEFLFPIICFLAFFFLKDYINTKPKSFKLEKFNIRNTDPMLLNDFTPPNRIYYSPESNYTNTLMKMVAEHLFPGQQSFQEPGTQPDAVPVVSCEEVMESDMYFDKESASVKFLDVGENGTWPTKLNYTIRMKEKYKTYKLQNLEDDIGPHENYGTIYKAFMRLQWAVDSCYIQLFTGTDIKQRISVQEFPFVRLTKIEGVSVVCTMVSLLCWMSLLLPFLSLVTRLAEDRFSGIEALLKLTGVSGEILKLSHFVNMLPICFIYCVFIPIILTSSSTPLIRHSSGFLMAIFLMLHFVIMMTLAFIVSSLLSTRQFMSSIAVYVYVLLWLPAKFLPETVSGLRMVLGLLPNVPLYWYWQTVAAAEERDMGITLGNMISAGVEPVSPATCLLFLLLQLLLLVPNAYCLRRLSRWRKERCSWTDLIEGCRGSFKVSAERLPVEEPEDAQPSVAAEYFESVADDKKVGIRIVNVSKEYDNQRVLKDVSLDVYQGEITVLLGHNGAGKTTLMSIITGMKSPSSGHVYLAGLDSSGDSHEAHRQMGICPQHNLFFAHLTVLEHVMLFTMLKGSSFCNAKKSSLALLEQLGIGDKASNQTEELSGGMKRRLQLACALAGDSSVLILDEPTAGLDVETRRELWNLLLSLRGSRTVLISTHFMEEADALGDRVAALHEGQLRCYATTMHLKRAVGTGYRLSFTTIGVPKESAITSLVRSHVPDATLKGASHNSLTYSLPAKNHDQFPMLFAALESARPELAIDTIGVGVSTIEEVFLKLCSDTDMRFMEDELDASDEEPTFNMVSGFILCFNQMWVLFRRQLCFITNKPVSYVIMYWFLPFLVTLLITVVSNDVTPEAPHREKLVALSPALYTQRVPARHVLYHVNDTVNFERIMDGYPEIAFENADDLYNAILDIGRRDVKEYARYLAAIEVNETDARVMYSTVYRHTAPVALNLLSNVMAAQNLPWASAHTAAVQNHPLKTETDGPVSMLQAKSIVGCVLWASAIVFLTMATTTESLAIVMRERISGARRIYIMAGCPPELYWLTTIVAHVVMYGALLITALLFATVIKDMDDTLVQPDFLGVMALVLMLGIMAYLPLGYLLCFHFGERATYMLLYIIVFIFGLITPSMKAATDTFGGHQPASFKDYVLDVISVTVPPHTFTQAAASATLAARLNAFCTLNRDQCPALKIAESGFDAAKCCAMQNPKDYFSTADGSPLWFMISLAVQGICLMILVVMTERGFYNLLLDRMWNVAYTPRRDATADVDAMARAERAYVSKAITLPDKQIQEVMLVDDIHKNYPALFGKGCNAVRGVSFSVKKGECFGLLGVNGAGKSTTFKMLTADETITRGDIYANEQRLKYHKSLNKYMKSFGYCPQFFGLDKFLTGAENLRMVLTMRGLAPADADKEVAAWIKVVGLQKYSGSRVKDYSGGCARRLSTAAALCGGARITLLDEPSAGVDVGARRRVWAAVRRALRSQRSLVISSHSMEEMEALCGRIAIMSCGRVRALGAAAALRAAHAAGHAVLVKLRAVRVGDVTDSAGTLQVQELKSAFHQVFDCTLKDEHTTMLHYHINESMSYSNLFSALEALQRDFPELVEDYSVTETTLEEVFLAFAKEAQAIV